MLEDFSSNSKGKRTYAYTFLFLKLKNFECLSCPAEEQLLNHLLKQRQYPIAVFRRIPSSRTVMTEVILMKNEPELIVQTSYLFIRCKFREAQVAQYAVARRKEIDFHSSFLPSAIGSSSYRAF
ncbi:hypothetical protein Tco_0838211 [Tanacetum coccineum]|uniref:Uncharacterized protein n=1 Tax=Tanacetum coccineum TaxID=301880 RepID=A0ABQ5ARU2_9ASTR